MQTSFGKRRTGLRFQISDLKPEIAGLVSFAGTGCFRFFALIAEDSFPGKLDFVPLFANAFNQNLLTFLQLVTHVLDAAVGDFGNVQQSIGSGKDFHEGAEIDDP